MPQLISPRHSFFKEDKQEKVVCAEDTPLIDHVKLSFANNGTLPSAVHDEEKQLQLQPADKMNGHEKLNTNILKRRPSMMARSHDELQQILKLAFPVIGSYLLEMLPGIVSIILVGHIHSPLTQEYIGAASMSVMVINLTGLSTGFGIASAMDTLCSQAYGANETYKMGTYFQTGFIVLFIAYLVVFCVCTHTTEILIALGQPLVVSQLAGTFTLYLLPGIPFLYLYELLRKVLQAQNVAMPMLYCAAVANCLNLGLGYYLVFHTDWGFLGAAIARTVANISFAVLLIPYLFTSGMIKTFWTGIHVRDALDGIRQFLSLGIPAMFQLCFEWWAFEVLALLCGLMPNAVPLIGANSVLMNINGMVYMFYLGLSVSANVRVGNALGAGLTERASLAAELVVGLSIVLSIICAAALLIFRTQLPFLFTQDEEINAIAAILIYVSAAFQVSDSVNAAVQGLLRGSGRQVLGAKLNFVAYYIFGIPFGAFIAFKYGYGVIGLWIGITVGLTVVATAGTIIIFRSDWKQLAQDAQKRIDG